MSSEENFFYTNWQAMTSSDWTGLIITVVTFILMVIAYFQVFRPKNREKLESYRAMALDDEEKKIGEKNG